MEGEGRGRNGVVGYFFGRRLTLSCKLPRSVRGLGGAMEIGATSVRSAFPNLLVYLTPIATLSTTSEKVGRFLKRHASSRIDSKQSNDFYSFSSIFVRYSKEENGNSRIVSCRVFHSQSVSVFPLVNSPLVAPRFIGRLFRSLSRGNEPRVPLAHAFLSPPFLFYRRVSHSLETDK